MATFIQLKTEEIATDAARKSVLRFGGILTSALLQANEKLLIGGVWKSRKEEQELLGALEDRPLAVAASRSLGFEILDELIILGQDSGEEGVGSYEDFFGVVQTFNNINLATAILRVSLPRTIVKNKLIGAPGTIKQLITMDDFNIDVQAFIYDNEGVRPTEQIFELMTALQSTDPLKIQSGYLSAIGLDGFGFVIDGEPQVAQIRGSENTVAIRFRVISDNPELYRIEKNV